MAALPRTARAPRRQQQQQPQLQQQSTGDEASSSPRAVLASFPLAQRRPSKRDPLTRPEGHALDLVHLLSAGWFGPLSRSAAAAATAAAASWSDGEEAAPLPPARRSRPQQQQPKQQAEGGRQRADASPSTSGSHRSGASGGSPAGAAAARLPRPTLPQAILSTRQQAQAAAIQDLPGIGTWAGRYRLFGRPQQDAQPRREPSPAGEDAPPASERQASDEASSRLEEAGGGGGGALQPGASALPAERDDTFGSPVVLRAGGFGGGGGGDSGRRSRAESYTSDQAREEAWRWRFSRKWATEQAKYYAEEQPASVVSDDLDALAFTQACGMGLNLQLGPTSAAQRGAALAQSAADEARPRLESTLSNLSLLEGEHSYQPGLLGAEMSPGTSTHGAIAAGQLLNRSPSATSNASAGGVAAQQAQQPAAEQRQQQGQQQQQGQHHRSQTWSALDGRSPRGPSATRSVLSMANKAQDLLQKQCAIEAAERDRWERSRTAGDAWAGRHLEPVRIDMLGRFKYCLLRVSDGAGHTRFLVRGRSGTSPSMLLQEAVAETAAACRAGGVPPATVEVVADGVMEWREDTERQLHLAPSTAPGEGLAQRSGSGDSPTKTGRRLMGDVSSLTASLVRQALPCHFRITTGSDPGRSASMSALANRI